MASSLGLHLLTCPTVVFAPSCAHLVLGWFFLLGTHIAGRKRKQGREGGAFRTSKARRGQHARALPSLASRASPARVRLQGAFVAWVAWSRHARCNSQVSQRAGGNSLSLLRLISRISSSHFFFDRSMRLRVLTARALLRVGRSQMRGVFAACAAAAAIGMASAQSVCHAPSRRLHRRALTFFSRPSIVRTTTCKRVTVPQRQQKRRGRLFLLVHLALFLHLATGCRPAIISHFCCVCHYCSQDVSVTLLSPPGFAAYKYQLQNAMSVLIDAGNV
jgi:hypothetical protein